MRRLRWLLSRGGVVCLVLGVSLLAAAEAGASGGVQVSSLPWPTPPTEAGGAAGYGECNVQWNQSNFVNLEIDTYCQGEIPLSSVSTFLGVGPTIMHNYVYESTLSGGSYSWTQTDTSGDTSNLGAQIELGPGLGFVSGSSYATCRPPTNGDPGPYVWQIAGGASGGELACSKTLGPQWSDSSCGSQCFAGWRMPSSITAPGGQDNWINMAYVKSMHLGPPETFAGLQFVSVAIEQVNELNDQAYCSGCGGYQGTLGYGPDSDVYPFWSSSSTPIPFTGISVGAQWGSGVLDCAQHEGQNMLSNNDDTFGGVAVHSGEQGFQVQAETTVPSGYGGIWSQVWGIDAWTCGTGPPAMPSNYFEGGTTSGDVKPGNCNVTAVNAQPEPLDGYQAGTHYPVTFTFNSQASEFAIDPNSGAGGALSTFGRGVTQVTLESDASVSQAGPSPFTMSFSPGVSGVTDPILYCEDAQGAVYDLGTLSEWTSGSSVCADPANPGCSTEGSFNLGDCFASAGWSLTDPVSWVTGALSDGACVTEWLVIPSQSIVQSTEDQFGVSSSTPASGGDSASQWLGTFAGAATSIPTTDVSAMQSYADSGSCSLPGNGTITISGHSFSACDIFTETNPSSSSNSTAVNTGLGIIRDLLSALVYLAAVIGLVGLVRRTLASGGAA